MKKKAARKVPATNAHRRLDDNTLVLLTLVVIGFLVYFALQANFPLASFLGLR